MDDPDRTTDDEGAEEDRHAGVALGAPVFNAAGELLGRARGISEDGFFVSRRSGLADLSVEHVRSGHEFGEAELMWRCLDCGEMGELDEGLPDECPNCGAEREALMYWTED